MTTLRVDPAIRMEFEKAAERIRANPTVPRTSRREVRVRATGNFLNEATGSKSNRKLISDEPQEIGGGNTAPTSLECVLAGIGFNLVNIIIMHAASMSLVIRSLDVVIRGDFDPGGIHGIDNVSSGFKNLDLEVKVGSDESEETVKRLVELAESTCPAINTFRSPPIVNLKVDVAA